MMRNLSIAMLSAVLVSWAMVGAADDKTPATSP